MRDGWRHFAAEFIGIFALVFVSGAAVISAQLARSNYVLLTAAVSHGLILAVMVTATMRVSGHLNPAVTIGFMVTKRIEPLMGALYIVAQIFGAVVAAYALKAVFPPAIAAETRLGGQAIALDVTMTQAILVEAIAGFILVFTYFGTAVDPHAPKVGGFAIGLAATANILAIGPLTGASMNPARSFGPAAVSGVFEGQIVFWAGPILGAILAALLYDGLFLRRGREQPNHGAVRPEG